MGSSAQQRTLSIYATFYLHAHICHPIVNNKVISLFATLSLYFVCCTAAAVAAAAAAAFRCCRCCSRCQAHLFGVFDYCCSPFYLRSDRVASQLQMHFLLLCCLSLHVGNGHQQWEDQKMCSSMQCRFLFCFFLSLLCSTHADFQCRCEKFIRFYVRLASAKSQFSG